MNKDIILFNSRDELFRIEISKVVYFEADGNYTHIVLINKLNCPVCMNLARMEQTLADNLHERATIFMRVGKRYIVNVKYVVQINTLKHKLVLSDGTTFTYTLDISKEALKNMKNIFVNSKV